MGKFKVGDRVRVIDESGGGKVGDEATITAIDGGGSSEGIGRYCEMTGLSRGSEGLFECRLELIEPDAATTENWDFDPRRELKVGDRVRAISCEPEGLEGVVAKMPSDGTILVEFDDFDGHDGSGALSSGRGWWMGADELELLPPTTPSDPDPDADLSLRVVADMSQLDGEINRILRRLKRVEKKARKLGIRLEFRDAA